MTPRADVLTRVEAVNLGLSTFADALRAQDTPVVQVDWRPPAGGDAEMLDVLTRLWGRHGAGGAAANREAASAAGGGAPARCSAWGLGGGGRMGRSGPRRTGRPRRRSRLARRGRSRWRGPVPSCPD